MLMLALLQVACVRWSRFQSHSSPEPRVANPQRMRDPLIGLDGWTAVMGVMRAARIGLRFALFAVSSLVWFALEAGAAMQVF